MKVQAVRDFFDLKERVNRMAGSEFEVSEDRFEEINSKGCGVLVTAIEEEPPAEEAPIEKSKKKAPKKTKAEGE